MLKPTMRVALFCSITIAFFTVLIGPLASAEAPETGDQLGINIDVKDAPVEQVLRMLAKAADVNIVVGPDVNGTVPAITLHDVTVDMALKMIAKSLGFYWYKEGNVYVVSKQPPAPDVAAAPLAAAAPAVPSAGLGAQPPSAPARPAVPHIEVAPPPLAPVVTPVMTPPVAEPKIVSAMIPVKHVDAGEIAILFGGVISDGGTTSGIFPTQKPSQLRRNSSRGGGSTPSDVFGLGFGMPTGASGLGQVDTGVGGGVGGRGSRGTQGGVGGAGTTGGGSGTLGTMLPGEMEPPIAFLPQNALLVQGSQEDIDRFQEILDLLDKPSKQVEISTKFIEVQTNSDKALGIDWSVSNGSLEFFNQGFAPGEAINNVVRFASGRFEAQLNALLSSGRATVINEPHVITANNQFAEINFFTTIPYFSAQVSYNQFGTREVDFTSEFIDVENSLWVVPRINADDSITVYLEPTLEDTVGEVEGPNGERIPIVTSQYVSTQVRVGDGETIVLGGLIRKSESSTLRETPLLSRIPIIGRLFQARRTGKDNSELLIFVTPRIVRDVPAQ